MAIPSTKETTRVFKNIGTKFVRCNLLCLGKNIPGSKRNTWTSVATENISELNDVSLEGVPPVPFCTPTERICLRLAAPEVKEALKKINPDLS